MSLTLTTFPELAEALEDLVEQYGIDNVLAAARELRDEIDDEAEPFEPVGFEDDY